MILKDKNPGIKCFVNPALEVERVQHKDACCLLFPLPCIP